MSKEFKGIWIPKEILELKDIGTTEKMVLSTILALDNGKGCTANNRYFADMFYISRTRVSLIIKNLFNKSYIGYLSKVKGGIQQNEKRVLNFTYTGSLTLVKTYNTVNSTVDNTIDIKYPFDSLEFINQWDRWLKYKKDEHRFTYKTLDSQMSGLKKLHKDSGGIESVALEMIEHSIANGYKGLFKDKSTNQQNGQTRRDGFAENDAILQQRIDDAS